MAPEKIREERERQNHLRDKVTTALATLREREKQLADHLQSPGRPDPQSESLSSLQRQYTALQEESERILQQKTEVLATLHPGRKPKTSGHLKGYPRCENEIIKPMEQTRRSNRFTEWL